MKELLTKSKNNHQILSKEAKFSFSEFNKYIITKVLLIDNTNDKIVIASEYPNDIKESKVDNYFAQSKATIDPFNRLTIKLNVKKEKIHSNYKVLVYGIGEITGENSYLSGNEELFASFVFPEDIEQQVEPIHSNWLKCELDIVVKNNEIGSNITFIDPFDNKNY